MTTPSTDSPASATERRRGPTLEMPGGSHGPGPAGRPGTATKEVEMRRRLQAVRRLGDSGMSTAEYAVGTVAACGFGGVLYEVVTADAITGLIAKTISRALSFVF